MSSSLQHSIGSVGAAAAPSAAMVRSARAAPLALPERDRFAPGLSPSYAALDLGTNNCRLLIARRAGEIGRASCRERVSYHV